MAHTHLVVVAKRSGGAVTLDVSFLAHTRSNLCGDIHPQQHLCVVGVIKLRKTTLSAIERERERKKERKRKREREKEKEKKRKREGE